MSGRISYILKENKEMVIGEILNADYNLESIVAGLNSGELHYTIDIGVYSCETGKMIASVVSENYGDLELSEFIVS